MLMKVMSIVKKRDDIIFLNDLRLNSEKQVSAVHDLTKVFFNEGYDFFHESTSSLRGVGILISRKLNYKVIDIARDSVQHNFLLIKASINESTLVIGSIYGPNTDEDLIFYDNLSDSLRALNCDSVIIGGDWNATWCCEEDVNNNIDVFRMRAVPSKRRSERIKLISDTFNLTDPFRVFYPNRLEYTYVPAIVENNNRSRLDFFLVSEDVMEQCNNCTISQSLNSSLFDHKCVSLQFKKIKQLRHLQVDRKFLKDTDLKNSVILGALETHVMHATEGEEFPVHLKNTILESLGNCNY
jgi:exonuclease III